MIRLELIMDLKFILKLVVVFYFAIHPPVFGEETLFLPVIEGSHSVGNDQNNLGINAYKKGKFNQALKHFQWALKLSPDNRKISESALVTEHHCDSNPNIPCDLKKPEKHKTEGSDTITTPNYMPSYGGSGY